MKGKTKFTVPEIVEFLRKEADNETIEGQLLKPKLIRELYTQLGDPKEEDFKDEYRIAGRGWRKISGFTKDIEVHSEGWMKDDNRAPTRWHIQRASYTKVQIVEEYTRAGWSCEVQPYNVLCSKYVKHPKYDNVWVRFYSSRDCNKYEYVIEGE